MAGRDESRCGEHSAQIDELSRRTEDLEESNDDLRDRVLRIEVKHNSTAETFAKFLWPAALLAASKLLELLLKK